MKKSVIFVIIALVIIVGVVGYIYFSGDKFVVEDEEWFQKENTLEITQFQAKTSEELEDNHMGRMLQADIYSERHLNYFLDEVNELGLTRIRLSFDWFDWDEAEDKGVYSTHFIDPNQIEAIKKLDEKGIKIVYTLIFWDETIDTETEGEEYSKFKTEEEIQNYLDYVQFIVSNLKGYVDYYEILNEPNHCEGTQQNVKIDDYINLVKRVVPVIQQEDPEAKIIIGAVSDLRQTEPEEYFLGLIESEIMTLADGISFHSMYGTSPDYEALKQYYYDYPSFIQGIKSTSSSNGFTGEYLVDEMCWRTARNPHPDESWIYTEITAAKYYARGIIINLGLGLIAGMGELESGDNLPKMKVVKNLATIMAGATPTNLEIEIQSQATNIEYYTFSLSNGDKLIVLWTDGVAVDDDAGVNADLTSSELNGKQSVAVDVLEGYEQNLIVEENTINDLIVRDYPLVIYINS
ncbi:MAG: hypothetical protein ABH804_01525 [archaeon]